jgi:hypothetical protein
VIVWTTLILGYFRLGKSVQRKNRGVLAGLGHVCRMSSHVPVTIRHEFFSGADCGFAAFGMYVTVSD